MFGDIIPLLHHGCAMAGRSLAHDTGSMTQGTVPYVLPMFFLLCHFLL